ncbi:uncharacterized protein LOC123562510 isoform X2 [Mercenaria mercenaria]|uniref:uncharacterized protein LOC123562510 isoform X2 n=1 Tax=Mercenaria mercenaria TaxID=6596 RepID=UPI00234E6B90|nr:uncharacterized protein LOC123562510 isoform X2 [Mercenaria mercenaria]
MGRATAVALINGHPGPRCFNRLIAEYITSGEEPDFENLSDECIQRSDVETALENANAGELSTSVDQYSDLLRSTGFCKVLSESTRKEAITALKTHYSFLPNDGALVAVYGGIEAARSGFWGDPTTPSEEA